MTDQELRELVRESIARQLGGQPPSPSIERYAPAAGAVQPIRIHASHGVYAIARNDAPAGASGDPAEGPCIIEPSVPCTHCDYCKSHGH